VRRWHGGDERVLVANFGADPFRLAAERVRVLLSSGGAAQVERDGVRVPPRTAVILARQ
jgi:hypothetical protein